jgi:hypothetical protein
MKLKLNCQKQKQLSSLVIIFFLFSSLTFVFAIDDSTIGILEFDNINDYPIFMEVYETERLVQPNVAATFYAEIWDSDNVTTELNVTLYYSTNDFLLDNLSVTMDYISNVSANTYRYEYLMTGKPFGTYMNYYFTVNDSLNMVREPLITDTPDTYSVQWSYEPVTIKRVDGYSPEPLFPPTEVSFIAVFFILLFPAIFLFLAFSKEKKSKSRS